MTDDNDYGIDVVAGERCRRRVASRWWVTSRRCGTGLRSWSLGPAPRASS